MAVNGKSKGSSFERKMANLFSKRFDSVTGLPQGFRRNPDSGSFWGASNQKRIDTHDAAHAHFGDLICPDNFKFCVESKFYKTGPTFSSIVKGKIVQWDEWIKQSKQDATNSKKEMMLIVKYNGISELVFLEQQIVELTLVLSYKNIFVYNLDDFLTLSDNKFFIMA